MHISSADVAVAQAVFDARAVAAVVHASPPPSQRVLIAELYAAAVYMKQLNT